MRLLGDGTVHLLWVLFSSAHCIKPLAGKPTYSYPHNDHTAGPRTCSSSPCQTTCRRRCWLWLFSSCLVTSRLFKASGGLEQRWRDFNFQQSTRCLKSGWQLKLSALWAGLNGKWNKTKTKSQEALEANLKAICLGRGSFLKHFLILATSWPDQAFEFQEVPATLEYLAWRPKKEKKWGVDRHSSRFAPKRHWWITCRLFSRLLTRLPLYLQLDCRSWRRSCLTLWDKPTPADRDAGLFHPLSDDS